MQVFVNLRSETLPHKLSKGSRALFKPTLGFKFPERWRFSRAGSTGRWLCASTQVGFVVLHHRQPGHCHSGGQDAS